MSCYGKPVRMAPATFPSQDPIHVIADRQPLYDLAEWKDGIAPVHRPTLPALYISGFDTQIPIDSVSTQHGLRRTP